MTGRWGLLQAALLLSLPWLATPAGGSQAAFELPASLDPATYASPSGRYRLEVNPSTRFGSGPARYRLTDGGREIWSREQPLTLWKAELTDEGIAVGFGYPRGYMVADGSLVVAIIGRDGALRTVERCARERIEGLGAAPRPMGLGLVPDPVHDRFFVRVVEPGEQDEWWWAYQLSTARKLPRLDPYARLARADAALRLLAAQPVAGTPLVLQHWWLDSERRSTYVLLEPGGQPVWRLDRPAAPKPSQAVASRLAEAAARERGAFLPTPQSRRFTLRFTPEAVAVTFGVSSEDGRWTVRELGRAPFDAPIPRKLAMERLPRIVLEPLPPVYFQPPLPAGAPAPLGRIERVWSAVLGPDDRLYVLESDTRVVHVFDHSGQPLRKLAALATDDFGAPDLIFSAPRIELDGQGRTYVGPLLGGEDGPPFGSRYLRFDPEGQRLGPVSLGGVEGLRWLFQPGTQRRWVLSRESVTLLDPEGRPLRKHQRHADGRWLGGWLETMTPGVAPDGLLAVLTQGVFDDFEGAAPARLSLYSPTGEPVKTLEVPVEGWFLAVDRSRIVMIGWKYGFLMNRDGTGLQRFDLPPSRGFHDPEWKPFISSSGKELFLYDANRYNTTGAFLRFRLPEP